MPGTILGQESRLMAQRINQSIELCAEDAANSKNQLKTFVKENKDRFSGADITVLLDMWDSLDLIEERLKMANEDLSDILFGSDD